MGVADEGVYLHPDIFVQDTPNDNRKLFVNGMVKLF